MFCIHLHMRISICFLLLGLLLTSTEDNFSIPKKFRGQYRCEMPSYEIEHDGQTTKVEATIAFLLVYESRVILKVGGKSFSSFVEKKKGANSALSYTAKFDSPFGACVISFATKPKSATIDLLMFNNLVFEKVK
jgi:hypothetical protein